MHVFINWTRLVLYILLLITMCVLLALPFTISFIGRNMDNIGCSMMSDVLAWFLWLRERIRPEFDCDNPEHNHGEEEED